MYNNYGPKPNEELVLGYGFALPDNDADIVALKLIVPESHASLAKQLGLTNERHLVSRSSELPAELLATIRLLVSSEDELREIAAKAREMPEGGWQRVLEFVDVDNELDAFATLGDMLDQKLEAVSQPRDYSAFQDGDTVDMIKAYVQGTIL